MNFLMLFVFAGVGVCILLLVIWCCRAWCWYLYCLVGALVPRRAWQWQWGGSGGSRWQQQTTLFCFCSPQLLLFPLPTTPCATASALHYCCFHCLCYCFACFPQLLFVLASTACACTAALLATLCNDNSILCFSLLFLLLTAVVDSLCMSFYCFNYWQTFPTMTYSTACQFFCFAFNHCAL